MFPLDVSLISAYRSYSTVRVKVGVGSDETGQEAGTPTRVSLSWVNVENAKRKENLFRSGVFWVNLVVAYICLLNSIMVDVKTL